MFESVVNNLLEKTAENFKAKDGDYIHDGLLHCGTCNTPKQVRVELFGEIRTPLCMCKCEEDKQKREQEERERIRFQEKIKEYRRVGFPESEMSNWTFANADGSNEKNMDAMKRYVENFADFRKQGKGLLLFGTVGTGKTYAAACVANALIDKGYPALVTNFARIANTVSGMFEGKQEYYDRLNRFPLLALDDLSAERKTEYMQEIVFNVVDSRYRAKLPLIVTTNLTWQELANPQDIAYQRIFSRLLEMCVPVKFEGADKRLESVKATLNSARDLLGL